MRLKPRFAEEVRFFCTEDFVVEEVGALILESFNGDGEVLNSVEIEVAWGGKGLRFLPFEAINRSLLNKLNER